ncbi:MAG: hypothetical protein ABSG68_09140 [Thermoguttaceae bacterium]|jgi:hypothetical protein
MRRFCRTVPLALVGFAATCAVFALSERCAEAAGPVQLEIVGDARGSALGFQQWMQALGRAGIKNVRFRNAQETDRPTIENRGTDEKPFYTVVGILSSSDELVLPNGRYRQADVRRLADWLNDLAQNGPPNRRERKSSFGLSEKQLEQVHADLAKSVDFSTQGMTRSEAVEKIGRQLALPLEVDGGFAAAAADKIEDELSGLSSGTALAAALRPIGYCLLPRASPQGLSYAVGKARLDQEVWPIGWPPEKPASELLPALYESRNVNVQGVAATRVLEAISGQLKLVVLLDHNAIARHGLDPAKAVVALPQRRTNYSLALRKLLFQAGLTFEVRIDEAGKPLLWVSTVKPV